MFFDVFLLMYYKLKFLCIYYNFSLLTHSAIAQINKNVYILFYLCILFVKVRIYQSINGKFRNSQQLFFVCPFFDFA